MRDVPVFVQNGRLDAVATNRLGAALFRDVRDTATADERGPVHLPRPPEPKPSIATAGQRPQIVALLRAEAGRAPYDRILTDLVGELATRSDSFRTLWASHDVRVHRTGRKQVHHPVVGDLDLTFGAMDLTSEAGLQLLAFAAAPGSASQDGLKLLATWAATAQLESDRADLSAAEAADKP